MEESKHVRRIFKYWAFYRASWKKHSPFQVCKLRWCGYGFRNLPWMFIPAYVKHCRASTAVQFVSRRLFLKLCSACGCYFEVELFKEMRISRGRSGKFTDTYESTRSDVPLTGLPFILRSQSDLMIVCYTKQERFCRNKNRWPFTMPLNTRLSNAYISISFLLLGKYPARVQRPLSQYVWPKDISDTGDIKSIVIIQRSIIQEYPHGWFNRRKTGCGY